MSSIYLSFFGVAKWSFMYLAKIVVRGSQNLMQILLCKVLIKLKRQFM